MTFGIPQLDMASSEACFHQSDPLVGSGVDSESDGVESLAKGLAAAFGRGPGQITNNQVNGCQQ